MLEEEEALGGPVAHDGVGMGGGGFELGEVIGVLVTGEVCELEDIVDGVIGALSVVVESVGSGELGVHGFGDEACIADLGEVCIQRVAQGLEEV